MNIITRILLLLVTAICIYISGWYVFHGSIVFHTDIARDFLLIEDIVKNKPLTLIGPRSGGIPGVFHGPLWLYLNVPAFVIGTGNPVTVGWFWMMLSIINLIVIFMTAQNLFRDQRISLFAVTLVAATTTHFTISSDFQLRSIPRPIPVSPVYLSDEPSSPS